VAVDLYDLDPNYVFDGAALGAMDKLRGGNFLIRLVINLPPRLAWPLT